jgi:hypothetical protein
VNLDGPRHPFLDEGERLTCWVCGSRLFILGARVAADIVVDGHTGEVVDVAPFRSDLAPEKDDPDGLGAECAFCGARRNDRPDGHEERWQLESRHVDRLWAVAVEG